MKFLALNSFAPPDEAPTARLLGDAASELEKRGHEVDFVAILSSYRDSPNGSRRVREAVSLMKLLWGGITARRPEKVVCLTSPPMLPVVGALVALRHRVPLLHWAMDIYPDVAVALDEVKEGSILERLTRRCASWAYRRCGLIVALDEDMVSIFRDRYQVLAIPLPPWPPKVEVIDNSILADGREKIWLYSGNLGRAHEWKTLLDAQKILEESGHDLTLVFQGGGAERSQAQRYSERIGLQKIVWKGYAEEGALLTSLRQADALVATQRPETLGCLWPSKLALASLLDRPLLWIGPPEGSVAKWIGSLPHGHAFQIGDAVGVAKFLMTIHTTHQSNPSDRIRLARETGISRWAELALE